MFENKLKWEYYIPKCNEQPVASLYTKNGTKILDVLIGIHHYYTIYSEAIPSLEQCIQIPYDKAIEAIDTINYLDLPKNERYQLRLKSACKIIEDKVRNYIINSFLSDLNI